MLWFGLIEKKKACQCIITLSLVLESYKTI